MKKLLLSGAILVGLVSLASAQSGPACDPGTEFGNGIYPDSVTNFVKGCKGKPYEQVISILVPKDTVASFQGQTVNADFENITYNSVDNLPTGLEVKTHPENGVFLPETPGCAVVTGITDEVGTHNLIFYLTANVKINLGIVPMPIPQDETITFYKIIIEDCDNTDPVDPNEGDDDGNEDGDTDPSTSVIEMNKNASFSIYPNPAKGQATISNLTEAGGKNIFIYNAEGKVAKTVFTDMKEVTFSTAELKAGVYIVKVMQGNSSETVKLIVE